MRKQQVKFWVNVTVGFCILIFLFIRVIKEVLL